MNKIAIIVNKYYKTDKFKDQFKFMKNTFHEHNYEVQIINNDDLLFLTNEKIKKIADAVLFFDKDYHLAKKLEENNIVINSSESIRKCDSKIEMYQTLYKNNLLTIKTVFSPFTFTNIGYSDFDFIDRIIELLSFPIVIKPEFGSFGINIKMANNKEELLQYTKDLSGYRLVYQEYIDYISDIRVYVIDKKVIASVERKSFGKEFRANTTLGGSMHLYSINDELEKIAIEATNAFKSEISGVDLLIDKTGKVHVCEVNTNSHFHNLYKMTGINLCEGIISYIETIL